MSPASEHGSCRCDAGCSLAGCMLQISMVQTSIQDAVCLAGVRTATSPREAVEMFYAAQNAGDTEQIAALMAEDVEYHDMVSSKRSAHSASHHLACQ